MSEWVSLKQWGKLSFLVKFRQPHWIWPIKAIIVDCGYHTKPAVLILPHWLCRIVQMRSVKVCIIDYPTWMYKSTTGSRSRKRDNIRGMKIFYHSEYTQLFVYLRIFISFSFLCSRNLTDGKCCSYFSGWPIFDRFWLLLGKILMYSITNQQTDNLLAKSCNVADIIVGLVSGG